MHDNEDYFDGADYLDKGMTPSQILIVLNDLKYKRDDTSDHRPSEWLASLKIDRDAAQYLIDAVAERSGRLSKRAS